MNKLKGMGNNHLKICFYYIIIFVSLMYSVTSSAIPIVENKEKAHDSWKILPHPDNSPKLFEETAFESIFEVPDESVSWYRNEVKKRKEIEDQGGVYSLAVLNTTLKNMILFVDHILSEKQFKSNLTDSEREGFELLSFDLKALDDQKNPSYKEIVILSYKLTLLHEMSIYRRIIAPLEKPDVEPVNNDEHDGYMEFKMNHHYVMSYHIFSNHLTHKDLYILPYEESCSDCSVLGDSRFKALLDNQNVILFPSFQPIDIDNFARFGHIPVYPIGLMTDYYLNADGTMNSPINFYDHDMIHIDDHRGYEYVESRTELGSPENRQDFQHALAKSKKYFFENNEGVAKVFDLSLFQIFHENELENAKELYLSCNSSFLKLVLLQTQTEQSHHYSDNYNQLSRNDIEFGASWVFKIYKYWVDNKMKRLSDDDMGLLFKTNSEFFQNYHNAHKESSE